MKPRKIPFIIAFILVGLVVSTLHAQRKKRKKQVAETSEVLEISKPTYDEKYYSSIQWRHIGPFRGGRSCAVAGVPGKPNLYYFGSTGGGIFRTTDGGRSWENISDGFFGGSIGCVAVSEFDPNVIYVGGGEKTVRGNVSYGYGVWKSEDAGKTWVQAGLIHSRHISRIRIHPRNPDIAWAGVMGDLFKPTQERGVYKTTDGGKTWKRVLFANENAGAVDLILDPNNPRILFASTWRIRRTPYSLESGGEGSAMYKSTDGGETWKNISEHKGLPMGIWGISGIAISPANSDRIWAIIENKDGGVFRSDDGGQKWTKLNSDRSLRQRAWYYTRIYADPVDEEMVYVVNVSYHLSKDGGRTFRSRRAPHGDHHDLWIAPEDPTRMIIGDDGGAQVTYDRGETWSTYSNQPTAQFYRVSTDNHFPYRIYAAQQDNSTVRIAHRTAGGSITTDDWESTAGCECGHIAVDPTDNDIVFGGCYDGLIQMKDHKNNLTRNVNVWPDNPMGHGAEGMKYRFQWNFPILFSPHDSRKLYTASNHLHVSYNRGQSWQIISPDLTRNDSTKLGPSGGPITKDNTSVEYYCTIFSVAESPRVKDLIWAGSDDGLIHLTRDGGSHWENVTPTNMPEWIMINSLEPDPFNDGGCYAAATMYKSGDYKPYLYKTEDYGITWVKIVSGIDTAHFTRVLRADPKRQGLLYAGTESGMYVSFDDGKSWQSFQLNLPIVPITDLTIKNDNLIAATQGRSLWMIDDLTILHQLSESLITQNEILFDPMDAYRMSGSQSSFNTGSGTNHPGGVSVHFYVEEKPAKKDTVTLTFSDDQDNEIVTFSTHAKENREKLELKGGANSFNWNMMYPPAERFEGMILWWASINGPKAIPGTYQVKLRGPDYAYTQSFNILKDPRSPVSQAEVKQQFDFIKSIRDKLTETHQTIKDIRSVRSQLNNYSKLIQDRDDVQEIKDKAKIIDSLITDVEQALYQTKNRSGQDPLNFPIRLNNKLASLASLSTSGDYPPTEQAIMVRDELSGKIDAQISKFRQVLNRDLVEINQMIKSKNIDAIILKKRE